MDPNTEPKRAMTRYLLGEMSEEERAKFEEHYLDDPNLFDELIALEDQMMRSYASGSGSETERRVFEKCFLRNAASRKRVDFAKSLMNHVSLAREPATGQQSGNIPSPTRPRSSSRSQHQGGWQFLKASAKPIQLMAIAAIVILIFGGSWLVVVDIHLRHAFEQMQLQHANDAQREAKLRDQVADLNLRLEQQEQQVAQLSSLGSTILPFVLPSRFIRQTGPQRPLVIPKDFSVVFLEAKLQNNEHPTYTATLETPEGNRVWRQSGLKSWRGHDGSFVVGLILPSKIFMSGSYILNISARTKTGQPEQVESYVFRVAKE